ncbi:MAG: polysaccharide deacetylase family protein [Candidatus Omnitrophota bacterium]
MLTKKLISLVILFSFIGCISSSGINSEKDRVNAETVSAYNSNAAELSERSHKSARFTPEQKDAIKHLQKTADDFNQEGKVYLHKGDFERAIQLFQGAKQLAPYDYRSYSLLANSYIYLKQMDDAFKILEEAGRLEINNDYLFAQLDTPTFIKNLSLFSPKPSVVSIAPFKDDKKCAVTFSFDDGARIVYEQALPLFEKYGFMVTIPINPGYIPQETEGHRVWGGWELWKNASERGHEIANHAMNHADLTRIDAAAIEKEINGGYDAIKEKIGMPPFSFVFPYDKYNNESMQIAQQRHGAIRVHDFLTRVYENVLVVSYGGERFSVQTAQKIIDLAIRGRIWLIAQCHSIVGNVKRTYKPVTQEFLEKHLAYIDEKKEDIWVDTFRNVYLYLLERKTTDIEIKNTGDQGVTFRLIKTENIDPLSCPLTVIVDTGDIQPNQALAIQEEEMKAIPVRISDKKLYVNVIPQGQTIHVEWE